MTDLTKEDREIIEDISNDKMTEVIKELKFPKILILHKKIEINTNEQVEKIFKEQYFLEILNYNDELLNTKIVYDIHIKQVRITQQQNGFFYPSTEEKVFLVIDRIEKNTLDTLNVDNGYFSLKLDNDGYSITIYYTGLPDFLGVFGSFFATLTLFASIICTYPAGIIYNQIMMNQIFRFVEDRDYNKEKGKKNEREKHKDKEEALSDDNFEMNTNSFKFKKFDDLNIGQISELYRKGVLVENAGGKSNKNNNYINNQVDQRDSKKSFEKKINLVNKSINSTINLLQHNKNKVDENSEVTQQTQKKKYIGRAIELEVINADKGSLIFELIEFKKTIKKEKFP